MAFLVDLDGCSDHTLDDLVKAQVERRSAEDMWRPMENPWARALVEDTSLRFTTALKGMAAELELFLKRDSRMLGKADAPWVRIDEVTLEIMRRRLEAVDPSLMTAEDYSALVDYLIQKYLPDSFAMSEAEALAARATLIGKIQANLEHDRRVTPRLIDKLVGLLPTKFVQIARKVLSPIEWAIMSFGRARVGENIRHVTESARHRMAEICLEHIQGGMLGQKEGTWVHAKTRLFDEFSALNRDFRRIAVTEGGEAVNQGYISALPIGRQVKRIEAYRDACEFCASINGKVFDVVAPDHPEKNGWTMVWPGKTNIGRSASPMKRVGGTLVPREPDELYWPAAGVQHPHCRGAWVAVANAPAGVSLEFQGWLQGKLDTALGKSPGL